MIDHMQVVKIDLKIKIKHIHFNYADSIFNILWLKPIHNEKTPVFIFAFVIPYYLKRTNAKGNTVNLYT